MACKPETTFIRSIHRLIPEVYAEKMNNPFRAGTADVWYSGDRGDLWVEYKYIPRIPRTLSIIPDLSMRQLIWLNDRYVEGRNVAVVLGIGRDGAVVYRHGTWATPSTEAQLQARCITRKSLASWILDQTGVSRCTLQKQSTPPQKLSPRRTKS